VKPRVEAFHLPARAGQRLCLYHGPRAGLRAALLYVHPFADEMNKTHRMAAMQARKLSEAGYGVLQIDLAGCGDSSGDFGDATWQDWVDDVVMAGQWLRALSDAPLWLWGLRAGCLLFAAAAPSLGCDGRFLFWRPAGSGRLLQQFFRLRTAGDKIAGKDTAATAALRQALGRGETVDIAGYRLGPGLALGLEHASLSPPGGSSSLRFLKCLEGSSRPEATLSPANETMLAQWRGAARAARSRRAQSQGCSSGRRPRSRKPPRCWTPPAGCSTKST
jgi:exosortase A-associated hydrolase 2